MAALVLAVRHARDERVAPRSKWLVGGGTLVFLVLPWCWPHWSLAALLLQLALCVYVLLYQTIIAEAAPATDRGARGGDAAEPGVPPGSPPRRAK